MAFVRSTEAHALIKGIDCPSSAVVRESSSMEQPIRASALARCSGLERPALAIDKVRFVGEAVAVVVAETNTQQMEQN